VTTDRGER